MLRQITPPSAYPVPLAEFADHLRLASGFAGPEPGTMEDPALPRCLEAATTSIERSLSTAFIRQTWTADTLSWASADHHPLPLAPVLQIDEVLRIAGEGGETSIPPDEYRLGWWAGRPAVAATHGSLPTLDAGARVTFQAGYGDDWNAVPADLRHAVLLLAAHYYERRSEADAPLARLPYGVAEILAPHRPSRL